jgi:hypothetical protein
MNSLPTVEQVNLEKYWDVIRKLDPELYLIKVALQETSINPTIIPRFVRALANLAYGTGYGTVRTFVQNNVVTQIKAEETDNVVKSIIVKEKIIRRLT